jgi:hypothetical protein
MKLLACLLLLASQTTVELLDETPTIAAGKWNYYPLRLSQQTARVIATFDVPGGAGKARLALLTHAEAERLFRDQPHGVLAATGWSQRGTVSVRVPETGDYDIVLDNRDGEHDVPVHVRVILDFAPPGPLARTASPVRRLVVVGISLAFFVGVVTYSTRRILRAIGR